MTNGETKNYMKKQDFTKATFRKTGITKQTLWYILSNRIQNPRIAVSVKNLQLKRSVSPKNCTRKTANPFLQTCHL